MNVNPSVAESPAFNPRRSIGAILTLGFATAVAVWCAWFLTHLPMVGMPEQISLPILLGVWLLGMAVAGTAVGSTLGAKIGLGAGLVTAIPGLLVLGTKAQAAAPGVEGLKPANLLIAAGFLVVGAVLGLVGGAIGGAIRGQRSDRPDWLFRFSVVAAAAVTPLLFIGGLVTSTNSGMAVPDWPNTFGTNMFLYPLGPRADAGVYLEHSHRLFGTLLGLTTLVLMVYVLIAESRTWLKILAVVAFLLVCGQGVLGGFRVREGSVDPARDQRILAMAHGILAQLTFGVLVAVAVYLSPAFKAGSAALTSSGPVARARQVKFFATGLMHATILQLIFGAMFRHFRDNHSLWSHVGFSVVVLLMGMLAGFAAAALPNNLGRIGIILRTAGKLVLVVVGLQFVIGWVTFALGVKTLEAQNTTQALVRTAHQANGGLLLGLAVVTFLWARRLNRLNRSHLAAR